MQQGVPEAGHHNEAGVKEALFFIIYRNLIFTSIMTLILITLLS
jgi:hypothetical protein